MVITDIVISSKKRPTKKTAGRKPRYTDERIAKALTDYKTVARLATNLKVTKVTAQSYVNRLSKGRKVQTKKVRQGDRGPLAVAYKVA